MWDELMAVNLRGLFFAIQAAATGMLERKSGSIVCVSSAVSGIGIHRGLPYVATKGGVDAMVPSLAYEWADRGVRVNSVAPGYIATDLTQGLITNSSLRSMLLDRTPLQRFGSPEEVAGLICYLASDASAFVTGQRFIIDGGFSIS
jgi:NAD(P)-dependent dehydrogenase (short-subunit alcohol dehydrogenase family)